MTQGIMPPPRVRRGAAVVIIASLAFGCTLAVGTLGCTNANRPLNPIRTPPGGERQNATRAALLAPVRDPAADSGNALAPDRPVAPGGGGSDEGATDSAGAHEATLDADGCFVGVAISGGGSRSANFSAACMLQLQRLGLLDRVDYISSVSGGSLTAAYYCLSTPEEWNPENLQRRMTHPFASDLIRRTFLPWNFLWMTATDWDRSDVLSDSFAKHLFHRGGKELLFGDLRPDRPRLLINATDLQSGKRFVFCNESFDRLNSDLSKYPISDAVAASAGVPVLLHHVTLRDYSTTFKQYVHLVDGGLTDNLGVRTLAEIYEARTNATRAPASRPTDAPAESGPYPRGAVFIIIDARTTTNTMLSDESDIDLLDSLAAGAGLASTALLNRASSATLADLIVQSAPDDATAAALRRQIQTLERTGYVQLNDRAGRPVRVIHLALTRVNEISDQPFAGFGDRLNSIQTYFNISETEAYHLYQAAELLIRHRFDSPLREIRQWLGPAATAEAR